MEGFLGKKARGESSVGRKNWKKRWFILENQTLTYYESIDLETGELGPRKGIVEVANTTVEPCEFEGKTFTFHILHEKNKPVIMQAADEKIMNLWLKALGEASRGENLFLPPNYSACYELLGLREASRPSSADVEHAFRRLSQQKHPDKGGDPVEFKRIHDAYSALLHRIQEDEDKMKFKQVKYEAILRKGAEGSGLGVIVKEDTGARLIRIKGILPEIQLVSFQSAGKGASTSGLIEAGGIKINDALLKVGEEDVRNIPLLRVAQKLSDVRVPPNSTVKLLLQRKEPRVSGGADAEELEKALRTDNDADGTAAELGTVDGVSAPARRKSKKSKEERRASRKSIKVDASDVASDMIAPYNNTNPSSIAAAWEYNASDKVNTDTKSPGKDSNASSGEVSPTPVTSAELPSQITQGIAELKTNSPDGIFSSKAASSLSEALHAGRMPNPNDIISVLSENEELTRQLTSLREQIAMYEKESSLAMDEKSQMEQELSMMRMSLAEQQDMIEQQQQQLEQNMQSPRGGARIVRGSTFPHSRNTAGNKAHSMSPGARNRHVDGMQQQYGSSSGRLAGGRQPQQHNRSNMSQQPFSPTSSRFGSGSGENVFYPEEYNPQGHDHFMFGMDGSNAYSYDGQSGFYEDGQMLHNNTEMGANPRALTLNNVDIPVRGVGPGGSGYVPKHTQSSQAKHITNRMMQRQMEEQEEEQQRQMNPQSPHSQHQARNFGYSGSQRGMMGIPQTVSDPAAIAKVASNNLRNPYRQPAPYKATRKVPVPVKTFKAM